MHFTCRIRAEEDFLYLLLHSSFDRVSRNWWIMYTMNNAVSKHSKHHVLYEDIDIRSLCWQSFVASIESRFTQFDLCLIVAAIGVSRLLQGEFLHCWYLTFRRRAIPRLYHTNSRFFIFDVIFVVFSFRSSTKFHFVQMCTLDLLLFINSMFTTFYTARSSSKSVASPRSVCNHNNASAAWCSRASW